MNCTNFTFLFKKPVHRQPKFFLLAGLFLISFSFVQAQPYQAATWAGYNSSTQTFPMNGTPQSSYVTSAIHNFSGLNKDNDSRTVWINPNTSSTLDIATAPYLSYTVTTNATLTFDRFVLSALAMLGSSKLQLRWSVDNFATSLGEFTADGGNYTLTSVSLGSKGSISAGNIEFRIYYYAASGSAMIFHPGGNYPSIDGTPSSYGGYASASLWYSNAVTTGTNMAISLNGTNQYADLGSDPALAATNIKTLECWVKFNSLAGNQEILSRSVVSQGIELLLYNNTLAFFCMNSANGSSIGYPTSNLQTGVWYHIAAAWNSTKESMRLYVNGKSVGTRSDNGNINTVGIANPTGTFKIGQWSAVGNDRFLNGTVDEVRIWNTARTASEIKNGIYGKVPANTPGLLTYYKMNESAGATIANNSTSPDAAAGSNGTLMNSVTRIASPVQLSNNAINFDGVDDHVSIGAPLSAGASYTKEAWVYVTKSTSLPNNIISSQNSPLWISSGSLRAGNNSSAAEIIDPNPLPVNTWVHVAVTFDAATRALKLYRNGDLVQSGTSAFSYTSQNNYIGAWFNGSGTESYLGGNIDEVRIWNAALTQAQIRANMNTALTGNEAGLAAYYSFNQGLPGGNNTGLKIAIDATANNNHGTLTNFALSGSASNWIASTSGITLLPVRFTYFMAQPKKGMVELNWATASEQNSKWFEVERSANGTIYSTIGTVAAAGNSSITTNYQFTDAAPLRGNSFYRLKQVDIDGKSMYSIIQKVVIGEEGFSYTLLQNPVSSQLKLNIQLPEAKKLKLEVRGVRGILLISKEQHFAAGNTTYTLPVASLASGTYFINIINEKSNSVRTFIKQ